MRDDAGLRRHVASAFDAPPCLLAQVQAAKRLLQGADAEAARVSEGANGAAKDIVSPRGGEQIPQDTPECLNMVYDNTLFQPEVTACLCWVYCPWVLQLTV